MNKHYSKNVWIQDDDLLNERMYINYIYCYYTLLSERRRKNFRRLVIKWVKLVVNGEVANRWPAEWDNEYTEAEENKTRKKLTRMKNKEEEDDDDVQNGNDIDNEREKNCAKEDLVMTQ